jgi:hypothetical protein
MQGLYPLNNTIFDPPLFLLDTTFKFAYQYNKKN